MRRLYQIELSTLINEGFLVRPKTFVIDLGVNARIEKNINDRVIIENLMMIDPAGEKDVLFHTMFGTNFLERLDLIPVTNHDDPNILCLLQDFWEIFQEEGQTLDPSNRTDKTEDDFAFEIEALQQLRIFLQKTAP